MTDVPIVDELQPIIEMQRKMNDLTPGNGRTFYLIMSKFVPEKWEGFIKLARELVYITKIHPECFNDAIQVCIALSLTKGFTEMFPIALFTEVLQQEAYSLLRQLTINGLFTINSIKSAIAKNGYIDAVLFFADFLDIDEYVKNDYTISEKYRHHLEVIRELKKDKTFNFEAFYDQCWKQTDIGLYIKKDDVATIRSIISTNKAINNQMEWSPFEFTPKPSHVTPVTMAAVFGAAKCFKYFVDKGGIISEDVVEAAIIGGNEDIMTMLRKRDADITSAHCTILNYQRPQFEKYVNTQSPYPSVDQLLTFRNYEAILRATSNGLGINTTNRRGMNCAHVSAEVGAYDALHFFVSTGAQITGHTLCNATTVNLAAKSGNLRNVQFLVSRRQNITVADSLGWTILHYAAESGEVKMVEWALKQPSINIDAKDLSEYNVTLHAAASGSISLIEYLVKEKNVDIHYKGVAGHDALYVAVLNKKIELIKHLLKNYFTDIDAKTKKLLYNLTNDKEIRKLFRGE